MRALVCLAFAACAAPPQSPIEGNSRVAEVEWPRGIYDALDVLIVVDDTPAMAPYVARTQAMLHDLDTTWDIPPDLHVVVATSAGELRTATPVHGDFLDDELAPDWWSRTTNHDGTIGDDVARLGEVGTAGATNAPLDATLQALGHSTFRRQAPLAVIIVAASDDTSSGSPDSYASVLRNSLSDPNEVIVSVVAPADAPRLAAFAAAFPNRSASATITDATYDGALALLDELRLVSLGAACIEAPADLAHPDCTVEIVQRDGAVQNVARCPGEHCWSYIPDPWNACEGGGTIQVGPYLDAFPSTVRAQCVVGN